MILCCLAYSALNSSLAVIHIVASLLCEVLFDYEIHIQLSRPHAHSIALPFSVDRPLESIQCILSTCRNSGLRRSIPARELNVGSRALPESAAEVVQMTSFPFSSVERTPCCLHNSPPHTNPSLRPANGSAYLIISSVTLHFALYNTGSTHGTLP